MHQRSWEVGTRVTASYKSGEYIGEIAEASNGAKQAVKILAVIKHPTQGDLHHPMDPDVPFFHQRRALAYQEIALVPGESIRPYDGEVPEYGASLQTALEQERQRLERLVRWAEQCCEELDQLRKEYRL